MVTRGLVESPTRSRRLYRSVGNICLKILVAVYTPEILTVIDVFTTFTYTSTSVKLRRLVLSNSGSIWTTILVSAAPFPDF